MEPLLVRIGSVIINPRHIACVLRGDDGMVSVYLAVPEVSPATGRPTYPVFRYCGGAAERVWTALVSEAKGV